MAIFTPTTWQNDHLAWQLMRYGPVSLFHKPQVLQETIQHLKEKHYLVFEFDFGSYEEAQAPLAEIATHLGVIQNYDLKPNLDGFNDYLRDFEVPDESGLVLVFHRFDAFQRRFPHYAHQILDIMAEHYHQNLLFGWRWITLVQSDDPQLQMEPLVAFRSQWNEKEWLSKSGNGVSASR